MAYSAKVLADSISPRGVRLTTLEVTFPRIVLAEFNTHRVFTRNSASSRAIPTKKMIERVLKDPFISSYWGKNQSGMQAHSELGPTTKFIAQKLWTWSRFIAVAIVWILMKLDVHKQLGNRLLEPWLWHTVIVTSTEWENFFGLRLDPNAQPDMRMAAMEMDKAMRGSTPNQLRNGEWHLPLVNDYVKLCYEGFSDDDIVKISVGRCARVSYLTHDGKRDPQADIDLADRLLKAGHMSPFEHAARPMTQEECDNDYSTGASLSLAFPEFSFCGNFRGWVQYRKTLPNEDNFMKRFR